jgi:hypothetical protein
MALLLPCRSRSELDTVVPGRGTVVDVLACLLTATTPDSRIVPAKVDSRSFIIYHIANRTVELRFTKQ